MTNKLELKSSHEIVYTVNVADVESIFYCKPTDPDILTVLMKDGKRLYCDEVCPVQEEFVRIWHDSNKEQPNFASSVAIWNPKYKNGEIISRCTEVYSDRIWAYIDDLLKM